MIQLSRTVRFCLDDTPAAGDDSPWASPRANTYAAWPAMRGLGRHYELTVACHGQIDPQTGYCINIRQIDHAVRESVLPQIQSLLTDAATPPAAVPLGELMQRILATLDQPLAHALLAVCLRLSPFYSIELRSDAMDHLIVRQQYEFSAAHRLHVAELSDEQNREIFDKCNNPAGHGHNYRLEVAVRAAIDDHGRALDLAELDELVNTTVIQHLDHTHLNQDVQAFAHQNPSVENIARVIWSWLAGPAANLGTAAEPSTLEEVRVWETEKTVCTYRGPSE